LDLLQEDLKQQNGITKYPTLIKIAQINNPNFKQKGTNNFSNFNLNGTNNFTSFLKIKHQPPQN